MHRVSVCYGEPADRSAFDEHYVNVHAPLVRKVPGLVSFTAGRCRSLDRTEAPYYLVATLGFPSAESLNAGLMSPQMQAAGADLATFATGGVTMYVVNEDLVVDGALS